MPLKNELIGKKFGTLAVLKYAGQDSGYRKKWLCKCDCGNERILREDKLKHLDHTVCFCEKFKKDNRDNNPDQKLIGKTFGNLLVIGYAGSYKKHKKWVCKCIHCGKEKILRDDKLKKIKHTDCKCIKKESVVLTTEYIPIEDRQTKTQYSLYSCLVRRHKKRTGSSDRVIDYKTFIELIESPCEYCGVERSNSRKDRSYKNTRFIYKYNGIDRIDSSKGYEKGNVVSCCKTCNAAKSNMSREDFLSWIKRVYKHSIEKRGE
jgi:hypothetical protein